MLEIPGWSRGCIGYKKELKWYLELKYLKWWPLFWRFWRRKWKVNCPKEGTCGFQFYKLYIFKYVYIYIYGKCLGFARNRNHDRICIYIYILCILCIELVEMGPTSRRLHWHGRLHWFNQPKWCLYSWFNWFAHANGNHIWMYPKNDAATNLNPSRVHFCQF